MFSLKEALAALMIRRSLKEKVMPLEELEKRHSDPEEPLFNDSSYFLGRGRDGSCLVVRLAFRPGREPEYWLAFHLPGKGNFRLKEMEAEEGEGFRLGSLGFACEVPGERWKIRYEGSIHGEEREHSLILELTFTGTRPLVNFRNISNPSHMAPVIAGERWTREFLQQLKEIRKVHLEQGGRITGVIGIDGEEIPVEWVSVRDHSWGTRSWKTWKRHVWLAGMLDDGEAFNLSMVAYDFLGQLSAGYLTRGDELIYFDPLPGMESFASDPLIPGETTIDFHSRDGKSHRLEFTMPRYFDFLMDGTYLIREGMGDFSFDGTPGMGVAEFGINTNRYDLTTG